jgi:hypothetical protein
MKEFILHSSSCLTSGACKSHDRMADLNELKDSPKKLHYANRKRNECDC